MTTPDKARPEGAPANGPAGRPPTPPVITVHPAAPSPMSTPAAPPPADPPAEARKPNETPAEAALQEESVDAAPTQPVEPERSAPPTSILSIDIGGTKVKILATGQTEPRKAPTGKTFTPARLVETVRELAHDWTYDAISIGCPCLVAAHGPRSEPGNLAPGWVGFDFASAFAKPVKMVNDAAMQALGSYEGGRMLFLGLGTGLGSTLITGHVIIPLELGQLPYDGDRLFWEVLGRRGLEKLGKKAWRAAVERTVFTMMSAFVADYVVIGGGNAKHVKRLPPGSRLGHNQTAFRGGFRLWSVEDVWVLAASGGESPQPTAKEALRLL